MRQIHKISLILPEDITIVEFVNMFNVCVENETFENYDGKLIQYTLEEIVGRDIAIELVTKIVEEE